MTIQFGSLLQWRGVLGGRAATTLLAKRAERFGDVSMVPAMLDVLERFAADVRPKVREPP